MMKQALGNPALTPTSPPKYPTSPTGGDPGKVQASPKPRGYGNPEFTPPKGARVYANGGFFSPETGYFMHPGVDGTANTTYAYITPESIKPYADNPHYLNFAMGANFRDPNNPGKSVWRNHVDGKPNPPPGHKPPANPPGYHSDGYPIVPPQDTPQALPQVTPNIPRATNRFGPDHPDHSAQPELDFQGNPVWETKTLPDGRQYRHYFQPPTTREHEQGRVGTQDHNWPSQIPQDWDTMNAETQNAWKQQQRDLINRKNQNRVQTNKNIEQAGKFRIGDVFKNLWN